MSQKTVAAYGTWSSPISAEMVAQAGVRLSAPWIEDGVVWWLEGRAAEAGRVVLVRRDPDGESRSTSSRTTSTCGRPCTSTAAARTASTTGVAFVSNFDDQRLYRVDPGAEPVPITPDGAGAAPPLRRRARHPRRRALDRRARATRRERQLEGRRERARRPADGRVRRAARDRRRSRLLLGTAHLAGRLAALLPRLESPVDAVGRLRAPRRRPRADGSVANIEHVAGEDGVESIWQPEWSPAGDLVFASDRSGWWNLERIRDGERSPLHEAEAEFGYPAWSFGASSYAFLGDGRIVCGYDSGRLHATSPCSIPRPARSRASTLDLDSWGSPYVRAEGNDAVVVAGAATVPTQVARIDVTTGARRRRSARASSRRSSPRTSRRPASIEFPTEGGLTAHAFFYPPTSPEFDAPGRRASAAHRREPRRPDRERDGDLQSRRAVLDESRLRRRRRRLRRLDRLRPRVPRAAERAVGRRRSRRLRQCRAVPRRPGRGRSPIGS